MTDNGNGTEIAKDVLPESHQKFGGYALKNINARLCLEYGSASSLSFVSKPGEGTKVSFKINLDKMK